VSGSLQAEGVDRDEESQERLRLVQELKSHLEAVFVTSSAPYVDVALIDRVAHDGAPESFEANLTFEPFYQRLLDLNYQGHEWAALLVASTAPEVSSPSVQAGAERLLDDAWRMLLAKDDVDGQGFAYFVRGKRLLYKGRLDEAAAFWRLARELLEDKSPVEEMNTAYLAFEAFQQGDLRGCQKVAEEALELAMLRRKARPQAFSRLLLAFFALYEGSFVQAEAELALADAKFEEITDPAARSEHPLVQTALGALHAFRGNWDESERYFAKALALNEITTLTERYAAVTRAVRAELTAGEKPERAAEDAERARSFWPEGVGGIWLAWALRAGGVAARLRGDYAESLNLLQQAYDACSNPFERGRSLLERGKTLIAMAKGGDASRTGDSASDAEEALKEAEAIFRVSRAQYWLTQTYLALAEADPQSSKIWQGKARTTALDDRAYTRLFESEGQTLLSPEGKLRIRLHGEPGVFVGGTSVSFPTKQAELLVYALALAGPDGEEREALTKKLWPNADVKQASQKLRTALWQAKISLGPEVWRLERKGDRLSLILKGAHVDDHAARAVIQRLVTLGRMVFAGDEDSQEHADAQSRAIELRERKLQNAAESSTRALATLETPLLAPWSKEPWVEKEDADRQHLVAQCRWVIGKITETLSESKA
jgi:tetratricopeptide (TPR) repeat protein